jgi:hypothetical protein
MGRCSRASSTNFVRDNSDGICNLYARATVTKIRKREDKPAALDHALYEIWMLAYSLARAKSPRYRL